MISKNCLKCGHTAQFESTPDLLTPCPACGAIYSKVEGAHRPTTASSTGPSSKLSRISHSADHYEFADEMRDSSLYPAFRAVVGIIYWVGIVLAVLCLAGGLIATAKTGIGPGPAIGGIVIAVIIYIAFRVTKEASLMLADIADATVRMASRQQSTDN